MTFPNGLFLKPGAWRADKQETPCGALTPMGVHAIDGMIDLCGPIAQVYCQSFRRVVDVDADDTTSMLFRMHDGMSGYLGTMTATGPGFSFQVFGSKGSVRLEGMTHVAGASSEERRTRLFGTCKFQPIKGAAQVWDADRLDVTRACLEAFAQAANGGRRVPHSARTDGPRRGGDGSGRAVRHDGTDSTDHVTRTTEHDARARRVAFVVWHFWSLTRMDLGNGLGHLTYSTLVHPADDWPQLWDSLQTYLPQVKKRISPNAPFGVCIRLSHLTAAELSSSQAERDKLKAFLKDQDLYVYTANAFVYGVFKNTPIKEQVYEPDWRTPERLTYTMQVADIMADICPDVGHCAVDPDRAPRVQAARDRAGRHRRVHRQRPQARGTSRAARADHRHAPDAGHRAGAALLSRDHGRNDRLLHGLPLHRHGGRAGLEARRHPDGYGDQRAAPASSA